VSYIRGHIAVFSGIVALAAVGEGFALWEAFLSGELIGTVEEGGSALTPALVLVAVAIATAVVQAAQQIAVGFLGETTVASLRFGLLSSLISAPVLQLEQRAASWFASRIAQDPALIKAAVPGSMAQLIGSCIGGTGAAALLLYVDAVTFSLAAGLAAVATASLWLASRFVRRLREHVQDALTRLEVGVGRCSEGARIVRAYGANGSIAAEARRAVAAARNNGTRLAVTYSVFGPLTGTLMQLAYLSTVVVGGYRVARGDLEFADLVTFLMLISVFTQAVGNGAGALLSIQEGVVGNRRIAEVYAVCDSDSVDGEDRVVEQCVEAPPGPPSVSLREASFTYDGRCGVNGLSFGVDAGSFTALVGASGSGKSTALGLVMGFFEPKDGGIEFVYSRGERAAPGLGRRSVGYVDQRSTALTGTVRDNLVMGRSGLGDAQLTAALNDAGLGHLLKDGDDVLDRPIGEAGLALSGGERQRLAFARAIAARPELLILDEPTSNLDGHTEAEVVRAVRSLCGRTTVLVAAHRLSTFGAADKIVVLEAGRVVGQGTHSQLMAACPAYRRIAEPQLANLIEPCLEEIRPCLEEGEKCLEHQ
jgi:ATP-binding cassette subfamily B protein